MIDMMHPANPVNRVNPAPVMLAIKHSSFATGTSIP